MKISKTIATQVDIKDMEQLYSGDIDLVVRNMLEDRYKGKCYNSCLITDILDIERGHAKINTPAGTGQGYVDVQCKVEAIEYMKGECVLCKVEEITKYGYIICKSVDGKGTAILQRTKDIKSVKTGQVIPVRVIESRYGISRESISINGTFYKLPKNSNIFKIGPLSKSDKTELDVFIKDMTHIEAQLKKQKNQLVKFFNDLLYPFKGSPQKGKADMKKMLAAGFVSKSEKLDKSLPNVEVLKKIPKDVVVIEEDPLVVYKALFNEYVLHMHALISLCEYFSDTKLKNSHKNVWDSYKAWKN